MTEDLKIRLKLANKQIAAYEIQIKSLIESNKNLALKAEYAEKEKDLAKQMLQDQITRSNEKDNANAAEISRLNKIIHDKHQLAN